MKSNTLIALVLLSMVICSTAIQIKEATSSARKHRRHRAARSLSGSKARAMMKLTLWEAIKDLFNKDDFRFTLGAVLKLLDRFEFPYSVTLFSNAETGDWDWTYSPKSEKEVNDAAATVAPNDLSSILAKYTDGTTLAQVIYDAAEDAAISFIKDLVVKTAKAVLVALFPPIAPVIAIWELLQESGVYAQKDVERSVGGKLIYNIGYTYTLIDKYGVGVDLFVQISLNFAKLSQLVTQWANQLLDFVKTQYERFVPKVIRDALGNAAAGLVAISKDVAAVIASLSEAYLQTKKLIIAKLADFIQKVKATKVGAWVIQKLTLVAGTIDWIINLVNDKWKKFKNFTSKLSVKVLTAVKEAVTTSVNWVKSAASSVWGWFKSWWRRRMSYKMLFRRANRRYFNMLRRQARRHRYSN
jgi:hypothetical protein